MAVVDRWLRLERHLDRHVGINALVLAATTQLRFLPAANFNGTPPAALTAHLVDSSVALTNNSTVNISAAGATGGTTQYSSATVDLGVTVNAVNDAPVVINGNSVSLIAIDEDTANPAGVLVSSLLGGHFDDSADNQTAVGGSSANNIAGIAVTANGANTAQGKWQYFSGGSWHDIATQHPGDERAPE